MATAYEILEEDQKRLEEERRALYDAQQARIRQQAVATAALSVPRNSEGFGSWAMHGVAGCATQVRYASHAIHAQVLAPPVTKGFASAQSVTIGTPFPRAAEQRNMRLRRRVVLEDDNEGGVLSTAQHNALLR